MVNVLFMCGSVYAAGEDNSRDLVGYLFLYEHCFLNKYIGTIVTLCAIY